MNRLLVSLFPLAPLLLPLACASQPQTAPAPAVATAATTTTAAPAAPAVTPHLREERATATVARLTSKDFAGSREWFDPAMRDALPESKIEDVWSQAEAQFGAFTSSSFNGAMRVQDHVALDFTLTFQRGKAIARVVFDDDGMVAGLFLKPA